jgi:hypothetical protein
MAGKPETGRLWKVRFMTSPAEAFGDGKQSRELEAAVMIWSNATVEIRFLPIGQGHSRIKPYPS